jgi:heme/copper-type cytochrome/quinol oxidase subunit 1
MQISQNELRKVIFKPAMKYFSETINYLTATAAVLFLVSLFFGNRQFDLHLHDTYYVIAIRQYFILLSFLLLAIWTIYKLMDGFLYSAILTRIQVTATIVSVIAFALLPVVMNQYYVPGNRPTLSMLRDAVKMDSYMADLRNFELAFLITILLFTAAQILLLVNIVTGISKRLRR